MLLSSSQRTLHRSEFTVCYDGNQTFKYRWVRTKVVNPPGLSWSLWEFTYILFIKINLLGIVQSKLATVVQTEL